ncbi:MAG: GAF domain-containing protein [Flavobacteriaceae bacterium]|jgi:hypothetical protein|nr:GAF domain-containing protein [Flavobacteriaceae bacterium]
MKKTLPYKTSPFTTLISFHKIAETFEELSNSKIQFQADYAKEILKELQKYPELIEGLHTMEDLPKYESILGVLLADLFPKALTHNEIKAVTIPYQTYSFNHTERFKKIITEAGKDFELNIRGFSEDYFYMLNCCVILKFYFKAAVDMIEYPLFVDIPDKNGIIYHYRVLFNSDFMDIIPTEKAKRLSEEEISELLDNFENIELWKEKFPEKSWILKGFAVISLFDATTENAVSIFKSNLLSLNDNGNRFDDIVTIFKSIYKIPDLKVGFTTFDSRNKTNAFSRLGKNIYSHLLFDSSMEECKDILCNNSLESLMVKKKYLVVSDLDKYEKSNPSEKNLIDHLKKQNVKSFIFAPLVNEGKLLGIIELSSFTPKALNALNANKLEFILPLIKDTVSRVYSQFENKIEALIQKEYTSIHPSVKWRFQEEVAEFITQKSNNKEYTLKDIVFKDVYPLYGQIDVQGSSDSRNKAIQEDLKTQIKTLCLILERINKDSKLPFIEQKLFELQNHLSELDYFLLTDSEHKALDYFKREIHPILLNFQKSSKDELTVELINSYFREIDFNNGAFYEARKTFDESVAVINKRLAALIDEKQIEAQSYFPHYYERFKTDGIEHNMYMGASIAPTLNFEKYYLYNLRLWQMQVMCEMENYFQTLKPKLSFELEVSSLILVFGTPISIRFRMDEKQFDIDGSYNVRYEIAKKRIDKAKIKNSNERITQKAKLTIVYSQAQDETEYMGYIKLLQHKGILADEIEKFDVEDLQGLAGMKALRVGIIYHKPTDKVYRQYKMIKV